MSCQGCGGICNDTNLGLPVLWVTEIVSKIQGKFLKMNHGALDFPRGAFKTDYRYSSDSQF